VFEEETMMRRGLLAIFFFTRLCCAFVSYTAPTPGKRRTVGRSQTLSLVSSVTQGDVATEQPSDVELERARQKKILLGILNPEPTKDPVLADPITKEPIVMNPKSDTYFGTFEGRLARRTKYEMKAMGSSGTYEGTSQTFYNLLEPAKDNDNAVEGDAKSRRELARQRIARALVPFIPPPLRSALATAGVPVGEDYVPMRDLFTSPAVSYAYERGWRNNFRVGGFPGEDEESRMAMDYFAPSMARHMDTRVVVDMSCASGLFTRRFANSGKYKRVLGCDYSASMLEEARRRIQADSSLSNLKGTQLDLVRCDVGRIPMQTNSVDGFHAGAAMHCWPDLPAAASEIYRVLKPGGRYFATTFTATYFGILQASEGGANGPSQQAFQYFESVDQVRDLMEQGGFSRDKINIEILQPACMVIRCEK
jgi:ubiquinone/menaquinone biosynthesis C-methylase UbiE